MGKQKYDFGGWATRANLKCADGRTIMPNAFKDCLNKWVPLVWNHGHNDPENVVGRAYLEPRGGDVYTYGVFNDSAKSQAAKVAVQHGDVDSLSIYANHLVQDANRNVQHGVIREVSLVLAGANPGAYIDDVAEHDDETGLSAVIYNPALIEEQSGEFVEHFDDETDKSDDEIQHAEETSVAEDQKTDKTDSDSNEETVGDIIDSMNEKQKKVLYALVGMAAEGKGANEDSEASHSDTDDGESNNPDEEDSMKHNIFDTETDEAKSDELMHSAMNAIIADGKRYGSLKDSYLAHADEYGIKNIDWLFPEAHDLTNTPQFVSRQMDWVPVVMNGTHHTAFSRIKMMFADITEDEARARGYIKGNRKKEEVFSLLKRTVDPTTIYKKQKLDRDDIIDITDFDVVSYIKGEMRQMLDEEIARAILIGDGRLASDEDKIDERKIIPVWKDEDFYTIKVLVKDASGATPTTEDDIAKAFIRSAIKSRKDYRGSGSPILFTTEDMVTDCLLLTDEMGRDLYDSEDKLRTKLRVSRIVTVPVMENQTREVGGKTRKLCGLILNLADYNVGADKGGSINMFDDFDIDYNQQKYLMETRCSGALTRPYSAMALEIEAA